MIKYYYDGKYLIKGLNIFGFMVYIKPITVFKIGQFVILDSFEFNVFTKEQVKTLTEFGFFGDFSI